MPEEDTPRPRTCCITECGKPAEWSIWNASDPHDYTDACEEHVGDLLGDKDEYLLYRLTPAQVAS